MGGLCTEFGPVLELEGLVIVERRSGAPAPKKWKKQQANLPSQTATFPSTQGVCCEISPPVKVLQCQIKTKRGPSTQDRAQTEFSVSVFISFFIF